MGIIRKGRSARLQEDFMEIVEIALIPGSYREAALIERIKKK